MPDFAETYQYYGAIHIHTKFSDGTGDVDSISKAAKKAGLDWIIITDHNYYDREEGIFNGVYVIKGEEISPEGKNHYLAIDINEQIEPSEDAHENVEKVRELSGFGFAAHPDEGVNGRKNKWTPIVWEDRNIIPDGVEIWNWFSNWGDNLNDRNIFSLAYSFFFKNKIITNPSGNTIKWWDELNQRTEKIVPAIGGVDAHALKVYKYIIPLTIFPYKTCFKTITNVLRLQEPLSDDFNIAKKQILSAVKTGQNMIINRNRCKFIPEVSVSNTEKTAFCGQSVKLDNNTKIIIGKNKYLDAKIIRDGKIIEIINSQKAEYPVTEKGKYRVEFYHKEKAIGYTNPIIVD